MTTVARRRYARDRIRVERILCEQRRESRNAVTISMPISIDCNDAIHATRQPHNSIRPCLPPAKNLRVTMARAVPTTFDVWRFSPSVSGIDFTTRKNMNAVRCVNQSKRKQRRCIHRAGPASIAAQLDRCRPRLHSSYPPSAQHVATMSATSASVSCSLMKFAGPRQSGSLICHPGAMRTTATHKGR